MDACISYRHRSIRENEILTSPLSLRASSITDKTVADPSGIGLRPIALPRRRLILCRSLCDILSSSLVSDLGG